MGSTAQVQLSLATALPAYRPGETVTALLHASTSLPQDVELHEVEVLFTGIERVDTSWVSPSYRTDVPAINSDRRRVQRHVVMSKLQAATQGNFSDSNLRRFLIRFTLPTWLPPTFKGTAVRYSYFVEAKLTFFQYDAGVVTAAAAAGTDPPLQGKLGSISTRLALQIWPVVDQGPTHDSSVASSPRGELGPAPFRKLSKPGDVFPSIQAEDFPIKCWEIGPGTAVEDAISHISKLGISSSGGSSTPFSPGRMQARQNSLATVSESASEISHDDAGRLGAQHSRQSSGVPSLSRQNTISEAERPAPAPTGTVQAEAGGAGGLRSFALRIGDAPLVRVCVHPPLMGPLQPGATLAGTLEFPDDSEPLPGGAPLGPPGTVPGSKLRCMQVSVMLETEEAVDASWRPAGKGSSAGGGGTPLRRVLEEQVEVTADTACTHFVFSLPRDATPTFHTSLVGLRWVLRFQFMAVREGGGAKIEQLTWTLPLLVLPPPHA